MTFDLRGFELDGEAGGNGASGRSGARPAAGADHDPARDALDVLAQAFGVVTERGAPGSGARQRTWLDTFDWRLSRAGLALEYSRASRGGRLLLSRDDLPQAEQPVTGWQPRRPLLARDLPAGPVRDQIFKLVSPRALLPVARAAGTISVTRLLNADGKTVARLIVDHSTASQGDVNPKTADLPPRLAIAEVRGYPGQARKAARLLAGVPGVSPAGQSVFAVALDALGRHPCDYTNGVDAQITAQMPAPVAVATAAAAPARHPGAERRRRSPRHRHRVPARPAGRRPPHPLGDQAARRRPAGRPRRAVRGRVQVARRPDHADQGPRRQPARFRRHGRAPGGRVSGGPRAVPRLPAPPAREGVPAAGRRPALGPVQGHHRSLAQGAGRGPRRGRPAQAPPRAHRRRTGPRHHRPGVPQDRGPRQRDHAGVRPRVPPRPAQTRQGAALPAGVLRAVARPGDVQEGGRRPQAAPGLPRRVPGQPGPARGNSRPGRRDAGRTRGPRRYAAGHG